MSHAPGLQGVHVARGAELCDIIVEAGGFPDGINGQARTSDGADVQGS